MTMTDGTFRSAIEILPRILTSETVDLDEIVVHLRPWLETKNLGMVRTNPQKTITWSRGQRMGIAGNTENQPQTARTQLVEKYAAGILDHIAIMMANYADWPETQENDRLVMTLVANLATAFTEELQPDMQTLGTERLLEVLEKPLADVGLRLVKLP